MIAVWDSVAGAHWKQQILLLQQPVAFVTPLLVRVAPRVCIILRRRWLELNEGFIVQRVYVWQATAKETPPRVGGE